MTMTETQTTKPVETKTPKIPKVIITPWRALESGAKLEITSVQTSNKLTLVPTITERGSKDNRWTYPSLGPITEENSAKLYDLVTSFRSEKWVLLAVTDAFDKECQDAWKVAQDEGKFITAISDESIQRTPKRMSVFYWKQYSELKKEVAGKPSDEQKAKLKELLLKFREAQDAELEAEESALMED